MLHVVRLPVSAYDVATHEAAHVVVGVATGLRWGRASARPWTCGRESYLGFCWFAIPPRRCGTAEALMTAAGVAWERACRPRVAVNDSLARVDWAELRELAGGRHNAEAYVRAASAMLAGLARSHARVTRALLERDLSGADLAALCRGEGVED